MAKRKRDEFEASTADSSAPVYPDKKTAKQVKKLHAVIESTAKTLHDALKTARGFERQKLGRRIKQARSNNNRQQWSRLEDEVVMLKSLDLSLIAQRYVYKSLHKTKRIAEHPAFKQLRVSESLASPPASTEEANVTARLYNSNPVKTALPGFVKNVKDLLGITDEKKNEEGKKTDEGVREPFQKKNDTITNGDGNDGMDIQDTKHNGNHLRAYDSRLASSSESISDSEDGVEQTEYYRRHDEAEADNLSVSSSDPETEKGSSSDSNSQEDNAAASSMPDTTTFLPTLAMGGYWSGSESEPEDDLPELGGGRNGKPQRKNRMGQQARRALWEKKFGKEANHIKKGKKEVTKRLGKRDEGWDLRRGATDDPDEKGVRGRSDKGDRRKGWVGQRPKHEQGHGQGDRQRQPQNKQDDKPIHPSWEAKRKAKEAMQAKMSGFQGKKITFD
ncbi:hypothetical protein KEM54_002155 [Ascosphaera aggregata]|nr:hypothetical protein KEM54_002155 [Ascosphaera aggregata]